MDYSLLVGIHDCNRSDEQAELNDSTEGEENGVEEDEDSTGSLGASGGANMAAAVPTPPDSPMCPPEHPRFTGIIDPSLEMFAVKAHDGVYTQIIYDDLINLCDLVQ